MNMFSYFSTQQGKMIALVLVSLLGYVIYKSRN